MNLNGDEKRIRQLFRDVSRDDQRRAPQFDVVLSNINSGMVLSQNRSRLLRLAMAAAILSAGLLIAAAIILRPSVTSQGGPASDKASTPVSPETPRSVSPTQGGLESNQRAAIGKDALRKNGVESRHASIKRVRTRRPANRVEIAMKSLFAWRSPTASLLRTTGDELLRSLPRLGESLQTIKTYSPDQFN
jgi:hypothetical protein